jgi:predicted short-subunit dehydrogenase-like oxidoreductase (DUF2520 family)
MGAKRGSEATKRGRRKSAVPESTVSIVGAGRLGTALARALASRGYTIEAVVARSRAHARRAAELVGTRPLALTSAQLDQLPLSRILFITTPDDAIAGTAAELAATINNPVGKMKTRVQRIALHASGALSSDVLQNLSEAGFVTGSMHPLVSVSDPVNGALNLGSAFFCIEGSKAAVSVARELVRALGAESFAIKARDKALYHAAAVMVSGHTTALFDIATEMLARCGLAPRRARAVLLPLLKSTFENLYTTDPARALTGTFARADVVTVQRHLAALRSERMHDALKAYTLLGHRSLKLAKAAGASASALKEIARVLAEGEKTDS